MPDVEIVPASHDDVPVILELIHALAEYERLFSSVVATEEKLREGLFGERPAAEVLLAKTTNGETAGFALFFSTYSTFLARPGIYLEDLFVKPEFRGRGIGLRLMQAVIDLATSRGGGRVEWSVLDWNTPSIEFYERLGARPVDGWTRYRLTL